MDCASVATNEQQKEWSLSESVNELSEETIDLHKEILLGLFLHCSEHELTSLAQKTGTTATPLGSFVQPQLQQYQTLDSLTLIPEALFPTVKEKEGKEHFIKMPRQWKRQNYLSSTLLELEKNIAQKFDSCYKQLNTKCFAPITLQYNECSLTALSRWAAEAPADTTASSYPVSSSSFRKCMQCHRFGHYEMECEEMKETFLLQTLAPAIRAEKMKKLHTPPLSVKSDTFVTANLTPGEPFVTLPEPTSPSTATASAVAPLVHMNRLTPSSPSKRRRSSVESCDASVIAVSNTYATVCKVCHSHHKEEDILLCDGCNAPYHYQCLQPPLRGVPVEEWFCDACLAYESDVSSTADLEPCHGFVIEQRKRRKTSMLLGNTALGYPADGFSCAISVSAGQRHEVPVAHEDVIEGEIKTMEDDSWSNEEVDELDGIPIFSKPIEEHRSKTIMGSPRLFQSTNISKKKDRKKKMGKAISKEKIVKSEMDQLQQPFEIFDDITEHNVRPEKIIGALVTWNASNGETKIPTTTDSSGTKNEKEIREYDDKKTMQIGSVVTLDHFNTFALVRLLPGGETIASTLSNAVKETAQSTSSLATCQTAIGSCNLGSCIWIPVKSLSLVQQVAEAVTKEKSSSNLANALRSELTRRKLAARPFYSNNDDEQQRRLPTSTTSPSNSAETAGVFQAERIIDERIRKDTLTKEYLIKWKGYGVEDCTWEPEKNIISANLVRIFYIEKLIKELGDTPQAHDCSSVTASVIEALIEGRNRLRLLEGTSTMQIEKPHGRICPFCERWLHNASGLSGHLQKHQNEPNFKAIREAFKLGFEYNYFRSSPT